MCLYKALAVTARLAYNESNSRFMLATILPATDENASTVKENTLFASTRKSPSDKPIRA